MESRPSCPGAKLAGVVAMYASENNPSSFTSCWFSSFLWSFFLAVRCRRGGFGTQVGLSSAWPARVGGKCRSCQEFGATGGGSAGAARGALLALTCRACCAAGGVGVVLLLLGDALPKI